MNFLESSFKGKNQWWKYPLVTLLIIISSVIGALPLLFYAFSNNAFLENQIIDASVLNPNLLITAELFSVAFLFFAIWGLVKWIHNKKLSQLINGTDSIRWKKVFFSFWLYFALMLISFTPFLIDYFSGNTEDIVFNFAPQQFILLMLIAFCFIPFQAGAEELFFRGYLGQKVAEITKSKWFVLVIPSILFGLLHGANPEVEQFGLAIMLPQYIFIGLSLGLISILDDGLESAIGAHTANNIFLMLFLSFPSATLKTSSLFTVPDSYIDPVYEFMVLIVLEVIFIYILAKKYNWKFSIMNTPITKPENTIQ